jgi:hypothetical protein
VSARRFFHRLGANTAGAAMLEFALVGPAFIVMLMGVLQVGIGLQNYNALRNVSADVARYAMIQYTTGNRLTNDQLNSYATTVAQSAPYLLHSRIIVTIDDVATPQVTGLTEKSLSIDYQIPSVLETMGLSGPVITYTRPLFLAAPAT